METFPGGKGRLGKRAGGLDKTNTWGGGFRTLDSRTTSWYPSQQSRCNNDTYQPTVIPDDHWVSGNVSKFRPTHLRMMKDRTIVKAGEEKNMAVQSPSGILSWISFKVKKYQVGNTWKLPQISWEEETLQGSLEQLLSTWVLELWWFQGGPKIGIQKIPGGQVRGAHYVLTREVHKGKHGHQLRIDWRSLTLLRSPDLILTCILHLTKSSCQELTSGTYFTITLLGKDGFRRPQPQTKTPWREAQPCKHSAAKSKVHKWCRSGVW